MFNFDMSEMLTEAGISSNKVGEALLVFILVGIIWSIILFIICYLFSPIKTIFSKIPIKYIQNKIKTSNDSIYQSRFLA